MAGLGFTPEQSALVTAAVAEAERTTDGEIVTIVTDQSDAYHDVALHYAVAAMLLLAGVYALFPQLIELKLAWFQGGWVANTEIPQAMLLLMGSQAAIFLIVRFALAWAPLRLFLTPRLTKGRRVRRRAVQFFKASAEKRTQNRVGILLYLSLAEHRAEIVADEAIHSKVAPERWGEAMATLVDGLRDGKAAEGMAGAVTQIAAVLAGHFPKTTADVNELPDRLIEL
jgi:putative membrane protein